MNRIYRVIWNCTLQVFQACSELTRRVGKTSTVNLRKSSGLTTKFSRLTLGVLLALSGSASGASLEVDNDQITNIDTDVAYDAYLVGWYGTGVLNILAGGNASLTTITTSVIGANEDSEGTVNVLGGTWRLYDSGNNARPLNVGQSGTGTLNIKQKGHVDGGYLRLGSSTGGVGTVNVEGEDSVLTTELFEIGSYGTGSLNITDKGYVTSSIVAILGYQAGSNGQVVVEKGGEWLIKNNDSSIEFQIGNQGTGEATIREGGLVTAENTIIGGNATGIGTLNVQDQDSVITVRRLYNGYFGNGTVNISNNGLINNKEYSLVGVQDGSHGVVNVTDKGHWNFLGTGEAFRYIYIGDAGDGELNVSSEGKVDSGIITAGMKETGTGNITVKDKNSVITNLGTNLGYDGHGEMNISNQGLVVSNGGSSLGYGETGVGNVSITTGGMWEVNKNVYTTIGVAGVGNLNISDGGKFVSQNITFLGDKASGIGTLNLMDATSSFDTVGINVGNFGSGIVNVSNGATLNSTGYGFIGGNASGKGIVNISTDSLWNLKTSSTNAQLLQVGVLGTGELNITTGGIVKARDTQIALNDKSKGDVRVDGQNSLLETFNMYVGTSGTGTLTLTNSGTLNVEGGEVYLGVFEPAVGTLNIGAAHGEAAADAGYITNATKVEFGSGEGVFVFNHTNNSDAGYQVDMLITGDDKDGKVIHDAGHTVFNAGNTYSGKTLVNDGLLTIASHTADGVTGMGSSEVTIASPGTLDILASTNSAGDYKLTNALKGDGLMRVQLSSSDKIFGFTHATGTEFAGVAQLKDSTFTLERDNTAALTHAMLQSDSENTTSVNVGEQSIGGLAMNGGTLIFDTDIPAATLAEGYISVDTLVVGAGDYTWKGRNYQVNGTGDVLIDVPKPWNDPMANNPLTTLNLLEHDDSHVGVQLVKAQTVIGSGGSLTLRDLQGDEVEADKTLHIAQNGTVVAEGDYGFRLTTAPGDGLYVNYGLKALNIHGGQKLTLAEHGGAGHERSRAGDGQLNTQANRYVLQLGGDLAQWSSNAQDRWHLGVMAGYANQHSNTQSNRVGYKSDGRISGYSAGLYATWYQNDANKTGAYVDSWALYNWFDNSVSSDNRSADDYDSRGVTASVEGGYTFEAGTFSGSEGTLNTWYVQPQAQITWMGVKDSDHTRKDGTRIETEGDGNVQTRLGVKTYLNSHHQRDDGKQREFQPYIEANWINNSKVYAVKMNGQTVGREGARNLGEVRTGVEAKVNNNLSLWGNVGVQLGDKGYSDTQGMLGVKYSW
ncbi:autotransporter outer membrane beta-barrel domain-containing protein [Escherichia coli]|uniref:autotransporter outer membrane beta-barrel domain-containing protein n=1 Tax=Escherichia coli TaxID=562 RepID=UPI00179C61BD|nr:autotransporter outer membrane beta-barrel domain-containing protein [Escherichia coli]EGL9803691.1 autotransporter outer membrane beta-barrel domain-containing protein [Escherichia coli]EHI0834099.1 autotransporter outer membrane beta-barrel domain-containing protein [Escherichia coli]EHJ5440673.1 autotransporter outer membrane beta-barrel domain-containing protein [Escherichia coli]EHK5975200.1 autotransporter outer membrane beta-barrel domain-containing protein [Escherichia coli]